MNIGTDAPLKAPFRLTVVSDYPIMREALLVQGFPKQRQPVLEVNVSNTDSTCAVAQSQILPVEYREIPGFLGYRVGSDGSVWTRLLRVGVGAGNGNHKHMTKTIIRHQMTWRWLTDTLGEIQSCKK